MKVIDHNANAATVQLSAPELDAIARAIYLAVSEGNERDAEVRVVGRRLQKELQSLDLDMGDDGDSA